MSRIKRHNTFVPKGELHIQYVYCIYIYIEDPCHLQYLEITRWLRPNPIVNKLHREKQTNILPVRQYVFSH